MRTLVLFCLTAFVPALLQPQSIDRPRSGIVFDSASKTFRPVLGTPGAALLGESIQLNADLHKAEVCSPQSFALAATGRMGDVALFRLDQLKTSALPDGIEPNPVIMAFSAGCTAAVLQASTNGHIQVLSGLPSKPVLTADFAATLPGRVSAIAVSDDGLLVLAAVTGKAVYLLSSLFAPVAIQPLSQGAGVAFHGNHDAIIADQHGNSVLLVSNAAGAPGSQVLASSEQGISGPTGVWFDAASQNVLVANSGSGSVSILHLPDGTHTVVDCHCQFGELSPLGNRIFQLAAATTNQPLMVLDAGAIQPRIVFVASPESHRTKPATRE